MFAPTRPSTVFVPTLISMGLVGEPVSLPTTVFGLMPPISPSGIEPAAIEAPVMSPKPRVPASSRRMWALPLVVEMSAGSPLLFTLRPMTERAALSRSLASLTASAAMVRTLLFWGAVTSPPASAARWTSSSPPSRPTMIEVLPLM
jgi:hypothetical protein